MYILLHNSRYTASMALPKRLAAAAARRELSGLLRVMSTLREPSDSLADRAVRLGIYGDDAAVLVPLADYEHALELEEAVEDIELELIVAERLARGPGTVKTLEEVAQELGLADELGLG
jgi:hypothetical protein